MKKLTEAEFVVTAVVKMRDTKQSLGIHSVISGLNDAIRKYFPGSDPVAVQKKLVEDGLIGTKPVKGGVMVYLRKDYDEMVARSQSKKVDAFIAKVLAK